MLGLGMLADRDVASLITVHPNIEAKEILNLAYHLDR